jgi:hypothetical protein
VAARRGLLFWGIAFIVAGAVALAVQQGIIPRQTLAELWRLWPVILIALGLAVLVSRTPAAPLGAVLAGAILGAAAGTLIGGGISFAGGCGGEPPEAVTERHTGDFNEQAEVAIGFSCGELEVTTAPGAAWEFGYGTAGSAPSIESDSGRLAVESRHGGFLEPQRQRWEVTLPTDLPLDVTVSLNAAGGAVDLAGANLPALQVGLNAGDLDLRLAGVTAESADLSLNAGSLEIVADAQTKVAGVLDANAGNVQLCAPPELILELDLDGVLLSHDLEEAGLVADEDIWRTPDGTAGPGSLRLRLEGNATNLSLIREASCA